MLHLLGSSKEIAFLRLFALERHLQTNSEPMGAYSAFIEEYHQLNYMREIGEEEISASCLSYYLPHHAVEKADSTITKLRVVFDASCSTDSGISLNQVLSVGPVIQDELCAIILRLRSIASLLLLTSRKMFRKIRVHSADYPLQRVPWRSSPYL
ncbi:uncharacterized protein LOC134207389 [Armigeres subalbatus]|uniref:uncharacterized protein LOC134207389 n=1 Tax=Armigeres subalbatus TaxID=124917 RepID=UPI002ECFE439